MCRPVLILGAFAVLFVATACSQQFKIIRPTYRPPPRPRYPVIRTAREANNGPLKQDTDGMYELHTELPSIYDDIEIDSSKRYARSLSTPGRGRVGSSSSRGSSRGHDTGPTHPGHNRRNARESGNEPSKIGTSGMFQLPTERSIIYDDIKIDPSRRYARSLSTPGRGRASGNSRSNRGHDTGRTHPGYNRRNARSLPTLPPFNPKPRWPPSYTQRPRYPLRI